MAGLEDLGFQLADAIHHGVAAALDKPLDKDSKDDADYGIPEDDETGSCGQCRHFVDPDACRLVEGDIDPDDICDYYEARRIKVGVMAVPGAS